MASFDLPETPQPRVSPALLVGAASPLWPYFAAAAAGGVAYWWMTQWARPVNLEAMLGKAGAPPVLAPLVEPIVEAAEAVAETVVEAQAAVTAPVLDDTPPAVGGEAAPISPALEASPLAESQPAPEPEVMFAVAAEPVIDEPAPVAVAPAEEAAPRPRVKKASPPLPETDA